MARMHVRLIVQGIQFDFADTKTLRISAEGKTDNGLRFALSIYAPAPTKLTVGDSIWIDIENMAEVTAVEA